MSENSETAVVRAQDETPGDRNDTGMSTSSFMFPLRADSASCARDKEGHRMVFVAHLPDRSKNMGGHHPKPKPVVLLLTDDVQNRVEAEKAGIKCSSGKVPPHRYECDGHFFNQDIRGGLGR